MIIYVNSYVIHDQRLKPASAGQGFYRNRSMRYGVLTWNDKQQKSTVESENVSQQELHVTPKGVK